MQVSSINSAADARRLMAMADPTSQAGGQAGATSKQIHAAAQQFEALILRQLLEPAMEPLMSGGLGGEQGGGGVYGYLATDVMANSLSQGGGLGLSKILEKQLTPKGSVTSAQVADAYRAGEATKS
ncbi:MAG TPA: flagellar biosynthesis protein FlgJ [Opitutaceae bacterium]|jgi:flagellar protein FlgJ|nr:MAG: flagellar rod assembly protein/muramidase FlgJ [Verrucomicrobia bacterium ADurb.Bin122]HOF10246.1 flagellar biosynthesis protein FlgJ [Opitutaceae bacterium]HOR26323.1 flagellar biosynthesis protein FlgJ [Opitutaceae bacterium]HOY54728.1 flagellar biosynthesis protein FlgJ [Opitutaceae bacterium]HPG17387.1 flagellar biosynthesis protein FlgJ [Opitutaceae bacterium]